MTGELKTCPVLWRVKDYADGWMHFTSESTARAVADYMGGALVQPLFASPSPIETELIEALKGLLGEYVSSQCGDGPDDLSYYEAEDLPAALKAKAAIQKAGA